MNHYKLSILNSRTEEFIYSFKKELDAGRIVKAGLKNKEVFAVVVEKVSKPDFVCNEILEVTNSFYSPSQLEVAKFIGTYYASFLGLCLPLFTPFEKRDIENKNLELKNSIILTSEQEKAFKFALKNKNSLIFGDTGSGKTEIYISLIYEVLKKGQNAIFLLPEISLTPQLENRLKSHFKDLIGVWHSKVTKSKKAKLLEGILVGNIRVVLGARSALFLPLSNIGLIVVDEEHDDSYKSNSSPRYNARDIALFYGQKINAKVVLGSATPSITSLHKIPHVRLKGGFFCTNKNIIYEDNTNEITEEVLKQISLTSSKKEQIIVFLPTRANFKFITCKECGTNITCPFCSVSLSLHKDKNLLKCHYCNYSSRIVQTCPTCKSDTMEAKRLGTAEVVDTLREVFKDFRVEKFDRDEIKTDKKLREVLKDFKDEKIDILVGTQMLSKGHDYHKVGLSVILGIDNVLALNDFKAREKALSLCIQLSGRSGRKDDGVTFIQTKNRDFFEKYLQNYEEFYKDELNLRKNLYPPFKKLARVLISHKSSKKAEDLMHKTLHVIEKSKDVEIVGYGKADIEKIANKFRYNILLRSSNVKPLLQAVDGLRDPCVQIDIDPINFS